MMIVTTGVMDDLFRLYLEVRMRCRAEHGWRCRCWTRDPLHVASLKRSLRARIGSHPRRPLP